MTEAGVHPATDDLIAFLNSLLEIDRDAVTALCEERVPCNRGLAKHPSVQVIGDLSAKVGMLGVLNGFCGVFESGSRKGWGPIAAEYRDGRIVEFRRTKNEDVSSAPSPKPQHLKTLMEKALTEVRKYPGAGEVNLCWNPRQSGWIASAGWPDCTGVVSDTEEEPEDAMRSLIEELRDPAVEKGDQTVAEPDPLGSLLARARKEMERIAPGETTYVYLSIWPKAFIGKVDIDGEEGELRSARYDYPQQALDEVLRLADAHFNPGKKV